MTSVEERNTLYVPNGVGYTDVQPSSLVKRRSFKGFKPREAIIKTVKGAATEAPTEIKFSLAENEFVDGWSSYLRFEIEVEGELYSTGGTTTYQQNYGPVELKLDHPAQLIREVVLMDNKNKEILRVENFSQIFTETMTKKYSLAYLQEVHDWGSYDFCLPSQEVAYPDLDTVEVRRWFQLRKRRRVIIPMFFLSDLFSGTTLLPRQLLNDARLLITWEKPCCSFGVRNTSFQAILPNLQVTTLSDDYGESLNYSIKDMSVVLDIFKLHGPLANMINAEMNTSEYGVPIKFMSYTYQKPPSDQIPLDFASKNISGTGAPLEGGHFFLPEWTTKTSTFTVNITQSYSNATKVIVKPTYRVEDINTAGIPEDLSIFRNIQFFNLMLNSYAGYSHWLKSYKLRVGEHYIPLFNYPEMDMFENRAEYRFLNAVSFSKNKNAAVPPQTLTRNEQTNVKFGEKALGPLSNALVINLNKAFCSFGQNANIKQTNKSTETQGYRIDNDQAGQIIMDIYQPTFTYQGDLPTLGRSPGLRPADNWTCGFLILPDIEERYENEIFPNAAIRPEFNIWVEHVRYVMVKADENIVLA